MTSRCLGPGEFYGYANVAGDSGGFWFASLTAASAAAGFVDQAHLTRAFRSAFDVTPRVYRQVAAVQYGHATVT